ncbi:hypothetical protein G7062_08115 [Erysipelothrix sp. HDW6C]|uniref:hypothetical protein n=1 Tax=Erysipelothrix sp. HDW6C TaxID=2714930 RepID=UPI00140D3F0F|nr:hypothetical protein [Erysipelothrix sp. HDW6C]QIK70255.1 hypothetical protein G7062_08115 [Erysipelothrix sp. HDW6C]
MKEWIREHKRKIVTFLVILIALLLLFFLKACNTQKETGSAITFKNHASASLNRSFKLKFRLLDYFKLPSTGQYLIDCDEDVAQQLRTFALEFKDESMVYRSLTYVGTETIPGMDGYRSLSEHYDAVGDILNDIADAMELENIDEIRAKYEALRETLKSIEILEETYEYN